MNDNFYILTQTYKNGEIKRYLLDNDSGKFLDGMSSRSNSCEWSVQKFLSVEKANEWIEEEVQSV